MDISGVTFPELSISEFRDRDVIAVRHGIQLRYSNIPVTAQQPYYSLPADYLGNQLKSYGGTIRYEIEYSGNGQATRTPDIIITGNKETLQYASGIRLQSDSRTKIDAGLTPGKWLLTNGRPASREQIMLVLANVENLLIKLQYIDRVQNQVDLLHITMDSAGSQDFGLGSASLVEECRCPEGYLGLSCETCAPGYVREHTGVWLGRCVRQEEDCKPGFYGNPRYNIPCQPCPCPLPNRDNQFSTKCHLGGDNDVVCECPTGYTGRRCERCEDGYVGNPLAPGGRCTPQAPPTPSPSHCDPRGTSHEDRGQCICKEHVIGSRCDQCAPNSFLLNYNSPTGCIDCFCMGVSTQCSSSTYYRDNVRLSFENQRSDPLAVVSGYEQPEPVRSDLVSIYSNEVQLRGISNSDNEVFYWSLPQRFLGDKVTSYGGNLTFTIRYTSVPGGYNSKNNAPVVVIKSLNDITLLYHHNEEIQPSEQQTIIVPILEDSWERLDGQEINRPHLLMALADVEAIYIKATYTTITEDAALSSVVLDTASPRRISSNARAVEVEQCLCPPGHTGLSCEDCSTGYKRSQEGIYLAKCELCECNGHSTECDPDSGVCKNCRHNTVGDNCEYCAAGFDGTATHGGEHDCQSVGTIRDCAEGCDQRGGYCSESGECECKANVEGSRCDQCRPGTFNLQRHNGDGCETCYCSGVAKQCSSSTMYRQQIPVFVQFEEFTLTNLEKSEAVSGTLEMSVQTNEVGYGFLGSESRRQKWYWNLPQGVLGHQIHSYGGNLTFNQSAEGSGRQHTTPYIVLKGNRLSLVNERQQFWSGIYSVELVEHNWVHERDRTPASRADLIKVLSNLDAILVLATPYETTHSTRISDVTLDTAVPGSHLPDQAVNVEICSCPRGHTGTSCEVIVIFLFSGINRNKYYIILMVS